MLLLLKGRCFGHLNGGTDVLNSCNGSLREWVVFSHLKAPCVITAARLRIALHVETCLTQAAIPATLLIRCHVPFPLGRSFNPKPKVPPGVAGHPVKQDTITKIHSFSSSHPFIDIESIHC